MQYPTDIVTDDGWSRIHQGHGLNVDELALDLADSQGDPLPGQQLHAEETHLRLVPRVKWCERLDGWPCDNEGEWHSHWCAVRPNDHSAYTIVSWRRVRQPQPA